MGDLNHGLKCGIVSENKRISIGLLILSIIDCSTSVAPNSQ